MKLLIALLCLLHSVARISAAERDFVVLVTADGLRHQELFQGADPELMKEENKKSSGIESLGAMREKFWAESAKERREKLMPFFWKELVSKHGVVFGNQALGSKAVVSNPHHFSYPGYAEILNGQPLSAIDSNSRVWSPRPTILEFLRKEHNLPPSKIAAFCSWDVFNWICMSKEGGVFCNAGYEAMPASFSSKKFQHWSDLQFQMLSPWDTVRLDAVTLNLALEYLRTEKPQFLYLALGETDDWAHNRRYDRKLHASHLFDEALRQVWNTLQATRPYRGRTTLIVATDHGRGRGLQDWTDHGKNVPGADEVWIGVFGPKVTKRGEVSGAETVSNSQIAATILGFLGHDPKKFNPDASPALPSKYLRN